jgi:hypothetical protein
LNDHCFSKENIMKAWIAAASAVMALAAGSATAGDVSWTVTVGSPRPAPRVIYAPPLVVYAPPQVVYQPVYQSVVYAQPAYAIPPGHWKHRHQHGWKHAYKHGYYPGRYDD